MTRKVGYGLVAAFIGLLAFEYVTAIGPAAHRDQLSACVELQPTPSTSALGRLPKPAPDIAAQTVDGKTVSLSQFRGRVVFLNFWAPWCPPCLDEMPAMDALQRKTSATILPLATGTTWANVSAKLRELLPGGTTMTLLLDTSTGEGQVGSVPARFGTDKLPETYLVDKQGVVRYYFVNKRDWTDRRAVDCLNALVAE